MGIGQNVTVTADDEAGSQRLVLELARRGAAMVARHEALEKFEGRIVFVERKRRRLTAARHLRGTDIDDRRTLPFGQFGEIRQPARLRDRDGRNQQE